MATKAQKRAAGIAKRAEYDAETIRLGLAAQNYDREAKQKKTEEAIRAKTKKSESSDKS